MTRLEQIEDSLSELYASRNEAQRAAEKHASLRRYELDIMRDADDMIRQLQAQRTKLQRRIDLGKPQ